MTFFINPNITPSFFVTFLPSIDTCGSFKGSGKYEHATNKGIIKNNLTILLYLPNISADILPLAIFLACLALNDLRFAFILADSPFLGLPAVPFNSPTFLPC